MNMAANERAEHDDSGRCRDPEDTACRDVQVVQRIPGAALPDEERDPRPRAATTPSPIAIVPSFGTEAKLIETMRAPTKIADTMPPRLSTGSLVSLT